MRYADTETVRVRGPENTSLDRILMQAWERYHIPLAVTEAHLACTREEQMRWLQEIWNMAGAARALGADVRAVTAWGLLGLYDWHCLLTRHEGCYESGVYDLSGGSPRPTALAAQVRSLATTGSFHHPLLEVPGWWRRDLRFLYPHGGPEGEPVPVTAASYQWTPGDTPPLLIVGEAGTLGEAFARVCGVRGIPWVQVSAVQFNTGGITAVEEILHSGKPWGVVYAGGYAPAATGGGSMAPDKGCHADGSAVFSAACGRRGLPYLCFTPDFVFDGKAVTPYHEASPTSPPNPNAMAIVRVEQTILSNNPRSLVVRTGSLFGPWDAGNFLTTCLNRLRSGRNVHVDDPATISVTYIPDLVNASLDLLVDEASGIWHLVNRGETCQEGILRRTAAAASLDPQRVMVDSFLMATPQAAIPAPAYRVLGSIRGGLLPPLEEAADRYLRESLTFS